MDSPRSGRSLAGCRFWSLAATDLVHNWISSLVQARLPSGKYHSSIASDLHKVKPEIYVQKYSFCSCGHRLFYLSSLPSFSSGSGVSCPPLYIMLSIAPAAILLGVTTSILCSVLLQDCWSPCMQSGDQAESPAHALIYGMWH